MAGETVLCTGQGIVVQSVDAEGRPVKFRGLCPDAALRILAAVELAPPAAEMPRQFFAPVSPSLENPAVLGHSPLTQGARAPPA